MCQVVGDLEDVPDPVLEGTLRTDRLPAGSKARPQHLLKCLSHFPERRDTGLEAYRFVQIPIGESASKFLSRNFEDDVSHQPWKTVQVGSIGVIDHHILGSMTTHRFARLTKATPLTTDVRNTLSLLRRRSIFGVR